MASRIQVCNKSYVKGDNVSSYNKVLSILPCAIWRVDYLFQSTARQLSKTFKKKSRFDIGIASELPTAYKKFWHEWKVLKPVAVHYIPQEGKWKRDDLTGEILPIQNIPIPLKYPNEIHEGIWGGEAVVKGTPITP